MILGNAIFIPTSGITPSGTLNISQNGRYSVYEYSEVDVQTDAADSFNVMYMGPDPEKEIQSCFYTYISLTGITSNDKVGVIGYSYTSTEMFIHTIVYNYYSEVLTYTITNTTTGEPYSAVIDWTNTSITPSGLYIVWNCSNFPQDMPSTQGLICGKKF